MPVVPTYTIPQAKLDPGLNFRDGTRASGDMFGAQVGEAISGAGQAMANVGQAIQEVNKMQAQAGGLAGVQQLMAGKDKLLLGDGTTPGYGSFEGKSAIDGYPEFQKNYDALKTKIRSGLDPQAQREFDQRAAAVDNDALRQGLTVRAQGQKSYIIGEHTSAANNFKEQALQAPSDEARFKTFIGNGLAEIDQLGVKQGWGPERIAQEHATYISSGRVKAAEMLAQSDPIAGLKYATEHANEIMPDDAMSLLDRLKPEAVAAVKKDASRAPWSTVAPNQFAAGDLPPQAYPLLGAISKTESPGYNVLNGGARFRDFSQHPGVVGPGGSTTAAGRYQFVKGTWNRVSGALGLTDFGPASQDRGAWWLAQVDYRARTGRSLGQDVNNGEWASIRRGLAPTWEGIAKLSDAEFGKMMESRMGGVVAIGGAGMPGGGQNGQGMGGGAPYIPPVSAPPVVAQAAPGTLSPEVETVLSGLPPAYADQLRQSALTVSVQDQAAAAKLEKDARGANADRYRNRLALGDSSLTIAEIQADTGLDDGQKATLTNDLVSKSKEQKTAAAGNFTAAADTYKNQAIDAATDDGKFIESMKLGLAEIDKAGQEQNWGADRVYKEKTVYVSDARKMAALKISLADPIAALKYVSEHAGEISPEDEKSLFDSIKSGASEAIRQLISPANGQPQAQLSPDVEAVLAGLPAAYANDLRKVAHQGVLEDQKNSEVALKAAREAQADRYRLRIANGDETLSTDDINEDPMLDDGQRAALINTFNEKNKAVIETRQNVEAFTRGNLVIDGYTEAGRKANDAVWGAISSAAMPDQQMPLLISLVKQTNVVPTPVVNAIRRGLDTRDPSKVADAMQLAQQLATVSPTAFKGDGGAAVQDAAFSFKHMVNDLGFSPQEAVRHYLAVTDPEKKRLVDPATTEKLLKNINVGTVTSLFDTATTWQPSGGFDPRLSAAMVADYKDLLKLEYEGTADETIAKGLTNEKFKRIYGRTDVTGSGTVMKYPIENYYPKVGDSYQYAQDQLLSDVNSAFNGGLPDPMVVGAPKGLVEKGNIDLLSRPQVKNADGSVSTVLSMSFEEDGKEVLVPKVSPSGVILTDEGAVALYRTTGKHLGKFDNPNDADTYAQALHDQQQRFYTPGKEPITPDMIKLDAAPNTAARIAANLPPVYLVTVMRKDANGLPIPDTTQNGMAWSPDPKQAEQEFNSKQSAARGAEYSAFREQQKWVRGEPVKAGSEAPPIKPVTAEDIPANRMVGAGRQAIAVPKTREERQAEADKINAANTEDRATLQRMLESNQAPFDALNAMRDQQAQQPAPAPKPKKSRPAAPLMGAQREKNLKGKP